LVGDAADGFPGIPGWGEKSAAAVLTKYAHLEAIPADPHTWGLSASRAARLAESLAQHRAEALLFRTLATLREDVPLLETLADLEWQGADARLKEVCHRLGDEKFPGRVPRWRQR
ncbi:MAG TPA: 5'-3' exonuclease H3TH domain-containing protein, partial [Ktedonobacteraceae bacterium]